MKRFFPFILAIILLFSLAACQPPKETESPSPPISPSIPAGSPSTSPPVLSASPSEQAKPGTYLFVSGQFLGCWSDGWYSAHTTTFTLGELFNRSYHDLFGAEMTAVRFYAADGPGQFNDPEQAAAALDPYGIMEGDHFIMELPGSLAGTAAALAVPSYGFFTSFNGQTYSLVSSSGLTPLDFGFMDTDLPDEAVSQSLAEVGIVCDLSRMERINRAYDMDGDGLRESTLELIQTPTDDSGYAVLAAGDPIFYALLLSDGLNCNVVAAHHIEYTDDAVSHFTAALHSVCDINQDGSPEIILQQKNWEWGHYAAYTLQNGQWIECLRAEYGM